MTMWSHGNFYWNELMTRDVEQAKKFLRVRHRLDL
jgi:predicted enzyme related to lactoylglutathione lyase